MKNSLIIAAMLVVAGATTASGVEYQTTTEDDCTPRGPTSIPPGPPPITYQATCETAAGFGLMAFSDNTALVNRIRAALAAGRTVRADVEGNRITGLSSNGAMRVIAVVAGPGGSMVICYQSF